MALLYVLKLTVRARDLATTSRSEQLINIVYYVIVVRGLFYTTDTGILENERF